MCSSLKISHLILIFALAALPFVATFTLYYPDERHYTDGALQMVQNNDWLIPHTAAGNPRLEKPPLAYWLIAGCYKIFGVSTLTSRLPFLLAACGTIFLTFRLAQKLTGKNETALLAAVVLASQPQFFLCATRSIPDALLAFFITMSAFGFLRLIVFEEFVAGAFAMAYGGAVGAALSKGLLGILIVVFAWAFCLLKNRNGRAIVKLIHWPIFITAIILAAGWFIFIFVKMPELAWKQFFGDQVTGNMHGHFWSPIFRVPLFAGILFLNFLPWSATAIEFFARQKFLEDGNISTAARNFILLWTTALIIGFSLGANISLRYLLPATPLMAILFADVLIRAEHLRLLLSLERIFKIAFGILVLLVVAFLFVVWQWSLPALLPLFVLFALVTFALRRETKRKMISAAIGLGLCVLICWPIIFSAAMPVTLPDRATQIAKALQQSGDSKNPVLLVGDLKLASRLRVALGKDWTVVQANQLTVQAKFYKRVIISENDAGRFVGRVWKIKPAASSVDKLPPPRELLEAVAKRQLPQMLARHSKNLWLATRE